MKRVRSCRILSVSFVCAFWALRETRTSAARYYMLFLSFLWASKETGPPAVWHCLVLFLFFSGLEENWSCKNRALSVAFVLFGPWGVTGTRNWAFSCQILFVVCCFLASRKTGSPAVLCCLRISCCLQARREFGTPGVGYCLFCSC